MSCIQTSGEFSVMEGVLLFFFFILSATESGFEPKEDMWLLSSDHPKGNR